MIKSFIIHLSKIPSSLSSARKLQTDLKNINIDAELFEGTYGNDAVWLLEKESRTVHPFGPKGPSDEKYVRKNMRPGVAGCFYSHYNLWKRCVELNQDICIFEDDVKIIRPLIPVKFNDILIIATGDNKIDDYLTYINNPTGEPMATGYYHLSMPGTVGYLISPIGAKKLLKTYKSTFLASDNAINKNIVDIQIHNYIVGLANLEKISLTKTMGFWEKFNG